MTVRDVSQKDKFWVKFTQFFTKNQEWREYVNVGTMYLKMKIKDGKWKKINVFHLFVRLLSIGARKRCCDEYGVALGY